MAIASVLTNSFKTELLRSGHNFDTAGATPAGSAFKLMATSRRVAPWLLPPLARLRLCHPSSKLSSTLAKFAKRQSRAILASPSWSRSQKNAPRSSGSATFPKHGRFSRGITLTRSAEKSPEFHETSARFSETGALA